MVYWDEGFQKNAFQDGAFQNTQLYEIKKIRYPISFEITKDNNFIYKRMYQVVGSPDEEKRKYQVDVRIEYDERYMEYDFKDIRFKLWDNTPLIYDFVEKVDGDYCICMVRMPEIPINPGVAPFLCVSGNPWCEAVNTDDAWSMYDDFLGSSLGVLTTAQNLSGYTITIDNTVMKFNSASGGNPSWYYKTPTSNVGSWEAKFKPSLAYAGGHSNFVYYFLGSATNNNGNLNNSYCITLNYTTHKLELRKISTPNAYDANTGTVLIEYAIADPQVWHTVKVTRDGSGNFELFYNGSSVGTATDLTYTSFARETIGCWSPDVYNAYTYVEYIKRNDIYTLNLNEDIFLEDKKWMTTSETTMIDGICGVLYDSGVKGINTLKSFNKGIMATFRVRNASSFGNYSPNLYTGFNNGLAGDSKYADVRIYGLDHREIYLLANDGGGEKASANLNPEYPGQVFRDYEIRVLDDVNLKVDGEQAANVASNIASDISMPFKMGGHGYFSFSAWSEIDYVKIRQISNNEPELELLADWQEQAFYNVTMPVVEADVEYPAFIPTKHPTVDPYELEFPLVEANVEVLDSKLWRATKIRYLIEFGIWSFGSARYIINFEVLPLYLRFIESLSVYRIKHKRFKETIKIGNEEVYITKHGKKRYLLELEIVATHKARYLCKITLGTETRNIEVLGRIIPNIADEDESNTGLTVIVGGNEYVT